MQSSLSLPPHSAITLLQTYLEEIGFFLLIVIVGLIIYYDDLQITQYTWQEVPTVYNVRVFGFKILDIFSVGLIGILAIVLILRDKVEITPFHKYIGIIWLVFGYACLVGFINSFIYGYDYLILIQDIQHIIYLSGFFCGTFYFLKTKRKWDIFVVLFFAFLGAKNILIMYKTFTGIGKAFGEFAFRASQNAEFSYFPMMFFPFLIFILKSKSKILKFLIGIIIIVYIFNSLIGVYRTVWVMLGLGSIYLFFHLDNPGRWKLLLYSSLGMGVALGVISIFWPRFLVYALTYKFASIFEWKVEGDRSNASRVIEIINVTNYVFRHLSFLQGMGLGAYWVDDTRRLLPDLGSGFTYFTRFRTTHMLYVTQLLKFGLVAMLFFWVQIYHIYRRAAQFIKTMSWDRWEKYILLGLNIGFICAFISSAEYIRLFTLIGINVGITSRYIFLNEQHRTREA